MFFEVPGKVKKLPKYGRRGQSVVWTCGPDLISRLSYNAKSMAGAKL